MAYKVQKCKCGDNDWDLIAQRFQCNCCEQKVVVNKFEDGVDDLKDKIGIVKKKNSVKAAENQPPNCS